jgi:isoleucyl-tRNA synthetase
MRYLLANLGDFDPATDRVPVEQLSGLDALILHRLDQFVRQTREAFERYEFAKFYHLLQNFCIVDLSAFYYDVIKDRLYTHGEKSLSRRSAQTVLEHLLQTLVRVLMPVASHLAEDVWQQMPDALKPGKEASVLLTTLDQDTAQFANADLEEEWADLLKVRALVRKALEPCRAEKKIGDPRDAQVTLAFDDKAVAEKVRALGPALTELLQTSQATVVELEGLVPAEAAVLGGVSEDGIHVKVFKADGVKCVRCRKFMFNVGSDTRFVDICVPCVEALDSEQ